MTRMDLDGLLAHRQIFRGSSPPLTGPLVSYSILGPTARKHLSAEIVRLDLGLSDIPGLLHSWGVMCSHPRRMRSYDGPDGLYETEDDVPFSESLWFGCGICGCLVINRGIP